MFNNSKIVDVTNVLRQLQYSSDSLIKKHYYKCCAISQYLHRTVIDASNLIKFVSKHL